MNLYKKVDWKDPTEQKIKFILELFNSSKYDEAQKEIDELFINYPNSPVLFNILGAIFAEQNKLDKAIENYEKSLNINPEYFQALNNLGIALHKLSRLEEAIENYKKALNFNQDFTEALNNLGNAYQELGRNKEALEQFNKLIKIQPNYKKVYNNLGLLHSELGNFNEAVSCYHKSISLNPKYEKTYNNLGNLLSDLGEYDKAHESYKKAIEINPKYKIAYSNLLLNLNYKIDFNLNLYLSEAKEFRENCKIDKNISSFNFKFEKKPKKLRLGFISADFGNHPGGFFTLGTLNELKKKEFELFAYSNNDRKDDLSKKFRSIFSNWRSIAEQDDHKVVEQILNDGIHILLDLQGHTANNRLSIFAYKPAPIQMTWLCQGSTGIPEIDYMIGNKYLTPVDEKHHFIEKVLRLPEMAQCFTPPDFEIEINKLPAKKNNFITFGCLNKLAKINDSVIEVWSKILNSVPNSKLILKNKMFDNETVNKNIFKKFKKYNISKNQLILIGSSKTRKDLLKFYNKIDISLDPFPFQGYTSTCESVWMGVPVIVLKGDRYLFHAGESINSNLDMFDWIAKDKEEYISKAISYSSDLNSLVKIRMNLRKKTLNSPVCDSVRFSNQFSKMLWDVWRKDS